MSKHRVVVEAVLSGKSQREVARLYGLSQPRVAHQIVAVCALDESDAKAGDSDINEPRAGESHPETDGANPSISRLNRQSPCHSMRALTNSEYG